MTEQASTLTLRAAPEGPTLSPIQPVHPIQSNKSTQFNPAHPIQSNPIQSDPNQSLNPPNLFTVQVADVMLNIWNLTYGT